MKIYIKSAEAIYAASMSRIIEHLNTNNIATLTSFITSDNEVRTNNNTKRSNKANKAANNELASALYSLGYSYIKVDGKYKEDNGVLVKEMSFFVICPDWRNLEVFTKDMINLAKKFEQESVIVWSCDEQVGRMYSTSDFVNYRNTMTFNDFNINNIQSEAWTQFKKNWFSFTNNPERDEPASDEAVYTATSIEEGFQRGINPKGVRSIVVIGNRNFLFNEAYDDNLKYYK